MGIRLLSCVLLTQTLAVAQSGATPGTQTGAGETAKAPQQQVNTLFGLPVQGIEFAGAPEIGRERLLRHGTQRVNEPLERAHIQQSIRNRYKTGLFENIAVDGRQLNGGALI